MEVQRRFARRYQTGVAYTVAKLKDSANSPFSYPNNQYDLADEWSQSLDDQRHTVNFNGSVELPWGFQTSVFYHLGSGSAFGVSSPENPFAYTGGSRTFASTLPVRVSPEFVSPSIAAGFSVVNRNALRGLSINRVDWRLSKSIAVREGWKITGIFEGAGYPAILNIEHDPREEMKVLATSGWVIGQCGRSASTRSGWKSILIRRR